MTVRVLNYQTNRINTFQGVVEIKDTGMSFKIYTNTKVIILGKQGYEIKEVIYDV